MRDYLRLTVLAAAVLLAPGGARASSAQPATITAADIQRLQDGVYDVSSELNRSRTRDPQRAADLQDRLDDLRDEVTYLRVKLRKEGAVPRSEYVDVRTRLEGLLAEARGESPSPSRRDDGGAARPAEAPRTDLPPAAPVDRDRDAERPGDRRTSASVIPVGQELDVRLQDTLGSDRSQVEDRFVATTVVDLEMGDRVIIPAGSEMRGVVSSVHPAGRIDRKGSMTVTFDEIRVSGRTYPMRGTVTQALESEGVRGEAGRIGTGAGVGAIIGGILGGFKGALAGILIGGGGVVAATEGKDVQLPAGTLLRVRLDAPPGVR